MTKPQPTRRRIMGAAAVAAAAISRPRAFAADAAPKTSEGAPMLGKNFRGRYCLNMATIMGQKLPIDQQIAVAIEAGYGAIEPWVRDIEAYQKAGGSLADLKKRCDDAGVLVASAIGFAEWIVDDAAARAKGLEQMKRDMEAVRAIGGIRIAAPPKGAQQSDAPHIPLDTIAERYHALLEVGRATGVTPELEIWGFSPNVTTIADAVYIAAASGHRDAIVLPDVYHLYKGGTPPEAVRLLSKSAVHVIHMNDYPAQPPRATITDAARVLPGQGIAPIAMILNELRANDCEMNLSLELFNHELWKRPALETAKMGIAAMRDVVAKALA